MSGLQIHGRVQVDITDDDHTFIITTKYSYKFEKMLAKSLKKKENRRLLLRSGALYPA